MKLHFFKLILIRYEVCLFYLARFVNQNYNFFFSKYGHFPKNLGSPSTHTIGSTLITLLSFRFMSQIQNYILQKIQFIYQIENNGEYCNADTILLRKEDGKKWKRQLLAYLASSTVAISILWYFKPRCLSPVFSIMPLYKMPVLLDY